MSHRLPSPSAACHLLIYTYLYCVRDALYTRLTAWSPCFLSLSLSLSLSLCVSLSLSLDTPHRRGEHAMDHICIMYAMAFNKRFSSGSFHH